MTYGKSNHNVSQAFASRLAKSREPEINGYEEMMQEMQADFIASHPCVRVTLADILSESLVTFTTMVDEMMEHYDDPHIKRGERIAAQRDIFEQNLIDEKLWYIDGKGTVFQFKTGETGKPKKAGRMTVSLGCPASLQGFRITSLLKYGMADTPILHLGGEISFCPKPGAVDLKMVFEKLLSPPDRYFFVYYSDDSCLAIRQDDGTILRCNVDISSCDASHTQALFDLMLSVTPAEHQDTMEKLIAQCKTEFQVRDVNKEAKNYVKLRPLFARLYSGSTLTTLINNLANILIAYSIAESNVRTFEDVVKAAARVGYIVTCQECSDIHQIQFLKHSPVYDTTGELRALLNPGVFFRLSGVCKGDLPGRKSETLRERGRRFQAGLIQGVYPRVRAPFIDTIKGVFADAKPCKRVESMVAEELRYKTDSDASAFTISSEEMWARYSLTPLEIGQLEMDLARCDFGEHYYSSATNKVLLLDYGLTGKTFPDAHHE